MAQLQHIAIEIETDDPFTSIKRELDEVHYQSTTTKGEVTIFRVPYNIRERNKNFYEPRIVSIGPYHWGREDLKCMEAHKKRYVCKILYENPDVTLDNYLEALRMLEPAARRCYHGNIEMDSIEFVKMLLYDACFIIQLVVSWTFLEDDIAHDISWNIPLIKSDLLMLENQIPLFVLQHVFELSSTNNDTSNLISQSNDDSISGADDFNEASSIEPEKGTLFDCLIEFLQHGNKIFSVPEGDNRYDHLLDFYRQCYMRPQEFSTKPRRKSIINSSIIMRIMHRRPHMISICKNQQMIACATELQEAGITFKKAKAKDNFSVHFSHGVLRIPSVSLTNSTTPQIMNLIAYEQCSGQIHKPSTRNVLFLGCIVKMPRDVLILQKNRIIDNKLGSEKAAVEFFNQLRYCSYHDYENSELFINMEKYCVSSRWSKRWSRYRATLLRDYFSNPWSIISLTAAVVLLLLTFLQTLYTVMTYYHSSHS